jgi:Na+/proline symporter/signal transduction histidine kinase
MIVKLTPLLSLGIAFLFFLFFAAYAVERGWFKREWTRTQLVYTLSLGVYCSSWAFYGSVGFAYEYGYGYLAYYMGICATFLLAPYLLSPILRLVRTYQLSSLADLFAFRYRSRTVGALVTIGTLIAILPLMALQIQAVSEVSTIINPDLNPAFMGFLFCLILIAFTILFGARHNLPNEQNDSLRLALAVEAVFKLAVTLGIGVFVVYEVYGGWGGLGEWVQANETRIDGFNSSMLTGGWITFMLLFMASPFVMPHMYTVIFKGQHSDKHLRGAAFGLPVYLFLFSLPVLPILWAGVELNFKTPVEFSHLAVGVGTDNIVVMALAYIGGMSAASGATIMMTLAMVSMGMNYLVMPIYKPRRQDDIYEWLNWLRRFGIVLVIGAAYGIYYFLSPVHSLASLGILAFVGTAQFIPGIVGTIFYKGANRKGLIAGLAVGFAIWGWNHLWPLIHDAWVMDIKIPLRLSLAKNTWYLSALTSLFANAAVFFVVSSLTKPRREEIEAAEACMINRTTNTRRRPLIPQTVDDFIPLLSTPLGRVAAEKEVYKAIQELQIEPSEYRPAQLRRLRNQLEVNLSGLLGPAVAISMLNRYLHSAKERRDAQDLNLFEERMEGVQTKLTGLAAELNELRRYHRQTLMNLPMGVCTVSEDGEILMWNPAMSKITQIPETQVVGAGLSAIDEPWRDIIVEFISYKEDHNQVQFEVDELSARCINLHKSHIIGRNRQSDTVVLFDDQSEQKTLEGQLMHSQRLVAIGGLAAGVAHEIGNPITGIDCLAQDMKYETDNPVVLEMAGQIREQASRVTKIVQSMMNFAHSGKQGGKEKTAEHIPHALRKIVEEALHLLELSKQKHHVYFLNKVNESLLIKCDPQRLGQVFINLLGNARDASPENSDIVITAEVKAPSVIISIEDQGHGISKEHLERIFEPFFTTKDVGKGTGLGLFITYNIIEEHFGQMRFESPANEITQRGTRAVIVLPMYVETDADVNVEASSDEINDKRSEL